MLADDLPTGTLDKTSCIRPVAQIWTSSAQAWAMSKMMAS
jgi:hypothetical protein